MSVLFSLIDAGLAFGAHPLLDGAAFTLTAGERLGLIGRNGTGKSSLLNVIAGRIQLDDGRAVVRDGLRIVLVEQEPVLPPAGTLFESLLARGTAAGLVDERDERRYWALQARLRAELDRSGVDPEVDPEGLSGGQNKRAALALAFALEPDLLLLDEPTNHLDIEAIEALEAIVNAGPAAIILTHDRRFLDQVATRITELDRGLVRSFPGNFATYEKVRGEQLEAEAVANRKFDKFWAQEEVWIRKGIEARRTRNEGRVRRLEALREARAARRERTGQIRLEVDAGERSGKLVCETRQAGISLGGRCLVRDLDLTIMRGDRIGLIGPNGIGKSTLLKLILGEYPPDTGSVRLGSNLQIAYFDQLREQLDPEQSVANTVSPGSEYVEINGARRHIMSYLQDFLFPSNRANSPVRTLSGGERNRLLLARLFCWCWTSPPTTWIWNPSTCWRACCSPTRARCCWSATTGASSTTWSRRCWWPRVMVTGWSWWVAIPTGWPGVRPSRTRRRRASARRSSRRHPGRPTRRAATRPTVRQALPARRRRMQPAPHPLRRGLLSRRPNLGAGASPSATARCATWPTCPARSRRWRPRLPPIRPA